MRRISSFDSNGNPSVRLEGKRWLNDEVLQKEPQHATGKISEVREDAVHPSSTWSSSWKEAARGTQVGEEEQSKGVVISTSELPEAEVHPFPGYTSSSFSQHCKEIGIQLYTVHPRPEPLSKAVFQRIQARRAAHAFSTQIGVMGDIIATLSRDFLRLLAVLVTGSTGVLMAPSVGRGSLPAEDHKLVEDGSLRRLFSSSVSHPSATGEALSSSSPSPFLTPRSIARVTKDCTRCPSLPGSTHGASSCRTTAVSHLPSPPRVLPGLQPPRHLHNSAFQEESMPPLHQEDWIQDEPHRMKQDNTTLSPGLGLPSSSLETFSCLSIPFPTLLEPTSSLTWSTVFHFLPLIWRKQLIPLPTSCLDGSLRDAMKEILCRWWRHERKEVEPARPCTTRTPRMATQDRVIPEEDDTVSSSIPAVLRYLLPSRGVGEEENRMQRPRNTDMPSCTTTLSTIDSVSGGSTREESGSDDAPSTVGHSILQDAPSQWRFPGWICQSCRRSAQEMFLYNRRSRQLQEVYASPPSSPSSTLSDRSSLMEVFPSNQPHPPHPLSCPPPSTFPMVMHPSPSLDGIRPTTRSAHSFPPRGSAWGRGHTAGGEKGLEINAIKRESCSPVEEAERHRGEHRSARRPHTKNGRWNACVSELHSSYENAPRSAPMVEEGMSFYGISSFHGFVSGPIGIETKKITLQKPPPLPHTRMKSIKWRRQKWSMSSGGEAN